MGKTNVVRHSEPARPGPVDQWIERLGVVLRAVDQMEQTERSAAFAFLKSRYRGDWPSDTY